MKRKGGIHEQVIVVDIVECVGANAVRDHWRIRETLGTALATLKLD